jgi:hypothetical protein
VVWCGVMEGGTVVGTHLVSSNQRRTTNAVRRLVVLIRGRSSSYAGVHCRTWAAVFVFVHGRVVSVCGQPFSYVGVSLSGEGDCLRTWAVVFVRRLSSLGLMMVVVCRGCVGRPFACADVGMGAVGDGSGRWTEVLGGG